MAWEQHGTVALGLRTVLFDVLAVDFPKHFAATSLLLQNGKIKRPQVFFLTASRETLLKESSSSGLFVHTHSVAGTHRFAVALDAVHDTEGFSQIWVPCVLQRVKPTSECTSCKRNSRTGKHPRRCSPAEDPAGTVMKFPNNQLSISSRMRDTFMPEVADSGGFYDVCLAL